MRKQLFLLVLILALANAVNFMNSLRDEEKTKLSTLRGKKEKVSFVVKNAKKVEEAYKDCQKVSADNSKLLYNQNDRVSTVMNAIQQLITAKAKRYHVKLINISWGNPEEGKGYLKLPISILAEGEPGKVYALITEINNYKKKIVRFKTASLMRFGDKIRLTVVIQTYKLTNSEGLCSG